MNDRNAFIIIDSGFAPAVLNRARNVMAFYDLPTGEFATGAPLHERAALDRFAGDVYGNHGSEVLSRLLDRVPEATLILVRAYGADRRLVRTGWDNGTVSRYGWSDAYLKAVELCRQRGYSSVANCSFGGYIHAMDGTGWESYSLGQATGRGRPGHIVVAGAGPGDGGAVHASLLLQQGQMRTLKARQHGDARYNFWAKDGCSWTLTAFKYGQPIFWQSSAQVPANIWNGLKQVTFDLSGRGDIDLEVVVSDEPHQARTACRFDCWLEGDGNFLNYVDPNAVAEPACFASVIAVGLRNGQYSARQGYPGEKPDVLLPGDGPVSFRLPEVTALVGKLLAQNPHLDVDGVRCLLGKYPDVSAY